MNHTKELWNQDALVRTPILIRHEYRRLYQLLEKENNIYAALLQTKDVLELLLKFSILSVLASFDDRKKEKYTCRLLDCSFSLGQWKDMGILLTKENVEGPLGELLQAVVSMYRKQEIVRWRNEEIGHGSLGFAEDEEMQMDIRGKVQAIGTFFEETMVYWNQIQMKYQGEILYDLKQIKGEGGELCIHCSEMCVNLRDYFWCMDGGIYLYDDYHPSTGTVFVMDYNHGKKKEVHHKLFYNLYLHYKKRPEYQHYSDAHGDFLMQSQDTLLKTLSRRLDYVKQPFLLEWLIQTMDTAKKKKGILLLRMERGTGKSAFCHAIDGLMPDHLGVADTTVRCYYARNLQQRSIKDFIYAVNNLFYQTESGDRIIPLKGKQPQPLSADSKEKQKDFANLLNYYNRDINCPIHKTGRTLLVIDGVDEAICQDGSVFDFLPFEDELEEGVFILLTCRTDEDRIPLSVRNGLGRTDIYCEKVFNKEEENAKVLRSYIRRFRIKKNNVPQAFTPEEVDTLMKITQYRFLDARLVMKLIESGRVENIENIQPGKNMIAFYLDVLHHIYGEKMFRKLIRILTVLVGAYEPLTLYELARLCGESHISVHLEAILQDIESFLLIQHTDRGNVMMLANEEYARYVRNQYETEMVELSVMHLEALNYLECTENSYLDDFMTYLYAWWEEICFSDWLSVQWKNIVNGKKVFHSTMELVRQMEDNYSTESHKNRLHRIIEWMLFLADRYKDQVDVNERIWCYAKRGSWYYKENNWKEAFRDLQYVFLLSQKYEININAQGILAQGSSYKVMADYYRTEGELDRAIEFYQDAESVLQSPMHGDEYHFILSAVYNNQAICYRRKKDYKKAEALFRKSIQEDEKLVSADEMLGVFNRATTLNALASCMEDQKDIEMAEHYYREALVLLKQLDLFPNTGWRFERVASTYSRYGDFLMGQKRWEDAEEAYLNACKAAEKVYVYDKNKGLNRLAITYFDLAYYYGEFSDEDNLKKCIQYYDKTFQYRMEQIAKGNLEKYENAGTVLNNRAVAKSNLKDEEGALEDYKLAHEVYLEAMWAKYMTDPESDIRTLTNIAGVYQKKLEMDAAWSYLLKAEEEWLDYYLTYKDGSFSILDRVYSYMKEHLPGDAIIVHMQKTKSLLGRTTEIKEAYLQDAVLFFQLKILLEQYDLKQITYSEFAAAVTECLPQIEQIENLGLSAILEEVTLKIPMSNFSGMQINYARWKLRRKHYALGAIAEDGLYILESCCPSAKSKEALVEEDAVGRWQIQTGLELAEEFLEYKDLAPDLEQRKNGLLFCFLQLKGPEIRVNMQQWNGIQKLSNVMCHWAENMDSDTLAPYLLNENPRLFTGENAKNIFLRLLFIYYLNQAIAYYEGGTWEKAREYLVRIRDMAKFAGYYGYGIDLSHEFFLEILKECDLYLALVNMQLNIHDPIEITYSPIVSQDRYYHWFKAMDTYVKLATNEQEKEVQALFSYLLHAGNVLEDQDDSTLSMVLQKQVECCHSFLQYFAMYDKRAYDPYVFAVFKKWVDSQLDHFSSYRLWEQCKKMAKRLRFPF